VGVRNINNKVSYMHNLPHNKIVVSGSFDDFTVSHVRFLEETGHPPKFSLAEREYIMRAVRYVSEVQVLTGQTNPDSLADQDVWEWDGWAVDEMDDNAQKRAFCKTCALGYHVITASMIEGFPQPEAETIRPTPGKKKVIVTGCYDWLHSGHIRFFEEASAFGDLYVAVGNDENVAYLKGAGHPMFSQEHRRYMVQAIRYVKQAVITMGMGWMDAEPNIAIIKPDIYLVNEDGDKPEKVKFCAEHNLEYVVLKRTPKEGLTARSSTKLRGF
jgi:cytidyltransferase-like protein